MQRRNFDLAQAPQGVHKAIANTSLETLFLFPRSKSKKTCRFQDRYSEVYLSVLCPSQPRSVRRRERTQPASIKNCDVAIKVRPGPRNQVEHRAHHVLRITHPPKRYDTLFKRNQPSFRGITTHRLDNGCRHFAGEQARRQGVRPTTASSVLIRERPPTTGDSTYLMPHFGKIPASCFAECVAAALDCP